MFLFQEACLNFDFAFTQTTRTKHWDYSRRKMDQKNEWIISNLQTNLKKNVKKGKMKFSTVVLLYYCTIVLEIFFLAEFFTVDVQNYVQSVHEVYFLRIKIFFFLKVPEVWGIETKSNCFFF